MHNQYRRNLRTRKPSSFSIELSDPPILVEHKRVFQEKKLFPRSSGSTRHRHQRTGKKIRERPTMRTNQLQLLAPATDSASPPGEGGVRVRLRHGECPQVRSYHTQIRKPL
jgi:hypothetical protein